MVNQAGVWGCEKRAGPQNVVSVAYCGPVVTAGVCPVLEDLQGAFEELAVHLVCRRSSHAICQPLVFFEDQLDFGRHGGRLGDEQLLFMSLNMSSTWR